MKYFLLFFISLNTWGLTEKKLERKIHFPQDFQQVLSAEMHVLQFNMNLLLESISGGKWDVIEKMADSMSRKYILKQEMTNKQKKELKKILPKGFVYLDDYFHHQAYKLRLAARNKESGLILQRYLGLLKSCMECHARYAAYLFSEFKEIEMPKMLPEKFYKDPSDWR